MVYDAELVWERVFKSFKIGDYVEYRIPGIIITQKGTLLCVYEGRMSVHDDWATIDTIVCRSTDDGRSWEETLVQLPERFESNKDDTFNNPVLLVDGSLIHLIFHQNYTKAFHCISDDDGKTWSLPREITQAFKQFPYEWNVCASGPGHGIAMSSGRLVVPIWLANGKQLDAKRIAHQPSIAGVIYSDDHGTTWYSGALIPEVFNGNETTVAETSSGAILYNIRNCEQDFYRRLALSSDGGKTIDCVWKADDLRDPMCFGSMISLGGNSLAFANCDHGLNDFSAHPRQRINLMVKTSQDNGMSWTPLMNVDAVGGYADIAFFENHLYVFYERTIDGQISQMLIKKYLMKNNN